MKVKFIACIISLIAVVAIFSVTYVRINKVKASALQNVPSQSDIVIEDEEYMICETKEGYIGVYSLKTGELIETHYVYTESLPEYDREILRNGLKVAGKTALRDAIEDYTS